MSYIHKFIKGTSDRTLLLLHGTGADENDLVPIGQMVAPEFNILSPRGKVEENGMLRFFRRLSEGVFDEEDIKFRAKELADFISESSKEYDFDLNKIVALGFSNGANMAAAIILLHPGIIKKSILLRPLIPIMPNSKIDLTDTNILINAGKLDQMILPEKADELAELLRNNGAKVEINHLLSGHNLIKEDLDLIKNWLD